jgi:hypothetical protein|tara:strand:- start:355 stop:501 length:147 start_codon:yes stop_codon:yes gene_type:complete
MLEETSVSVPSLRVTRKVIWVEKNILGEDSDHLEIIKTIKDRSGEKIE